MANENARDFAASSGVNPRPVSCADDFDAFGQSEGQFLDNRRAGFGEAVGTDRDGAEITDACDRANQSCGAVEVAQGFIID